MHKSNFQKILISIFTLGLMFSKTLMANDLKIDVYNPGTKSLFPVTSVIISGESETVLIDGQFQKNDAQNLVKKIKDSGKNLTTIYISHSDPDYYFGLDVIQKAFPKAKIVATKETELAIKKSMNGKLAYWGPILKENAPKKLILPDILSGNKIVIEDKILEIKGLDGKTPERSYVWIPSLKTVVGGVINFNKTHVWIADTQTVESRKNWLLTLNEIKKLQPALVIPGHFLEETPKKTESVDFTIEYLKVFEAENSKAKNSAELINAMKNKYPKLGEVSSLELSSKVVKGEMKWPQ